MAESINYASRYSNQIDERFTLGSVTDTAINKDYDFTDVNKVLVYSMETTELNDYNMLGGMSRYGNPEDLKNHLQELTLTQDKSFTFTIDWRNCDDTFMTMQAGRCLQREIDEVITPTVDKYRLSKMAEAAETIILNNTIDGLYKAILEANAELTENMVPLTGRIAFISPKSHQYIKMNSIYTGIGDKAHEIARTGNAYFIDGVEMKVVPSSYLPAGVQVMITHPCATTAPMKLAEYNTHKNPPGVNGWLVEGRIYYDAFVLNNKKKAIALIKDIPTTEEPAPDESGESV